MTCIRAHSTMWLSVSVIVALVAVACGSDAQTIAARDGEELVPASLPEGWQRCYGAPSQREEASSSWWTQTFGPLDGEGRCTAVVAVTQIPPADSPHSPAEAEWRDVKVGEANDGLYWEDRNAGTHVLLMWAFRQNLIFEGDLDAVSLAELKSFAVGAYEGQRVETPAGCDDERSDLSDEPIISQLSGHADRMYLDDGCPVRLDVAAIGAFSDSDHCWPGVGYGNIGETRFYRDPEQLFNDPELAAGFDPDVELPATATRSGYQQGDRELWVDPADPTTVYVVHPDHTEAWPVSDESFGCA